MSANDSIFIASEELSNKWMKHILFKIHFRLHFANEKSFLKIYAFIASRFPLIFLCKVRHREMVSHQATIYGKTMIQNITLMCLFLAYNFIKISEW